ncbi:hypothetical protein PYCC9005_004972 [Savitreella phatthalungensis]
MTQPYHEAHGGHISGMIRDSAAGWFLRKITGNRVLQYPEERDPSYFIEKYSVEGVKRREEQARREQQQERSNSTDTLVGQRRSSDENSPTREKQKNSDEQEKGEDYNMVKFEDNDFDDPMNWPTYKKGLTIFLISLLTFGVYGAASQISVAVGYLIQDFGIAPVTAALTLSIYVFGYAVGPMIWAPLSETTIGRNPIYILTLIAYCASQVGVWLAPNIGCLLAMRFITGFFSSPALANGGASIGDVLNAKYRARGIYLWGAGAVAGPTVAPLIAGWGALGTNGWRITMLEVLWLAGGVLIVLIFLLPETSSKAILAQRTKRLRKITGNEKLTCEAIVEQEQTDPKAMIKELLWRPIAISSDIIVLLINLQIAAVYIVLYASFELVPLYLEQSKGFNIGLVGTFFISTAIGVILAIIPYEFYLSFFIFPKYDKHGKIEPEDRLWPSMVGGLLLAASVFWVSFSASRGDSWIVFAFGFVCFGAGAFLLFQGALSYLTDACPVYAASCLASNDLFRSFAGGAAPLFTRQWIEGWSYAAFGGILGGFAAALIPVPFLFWKFGPTLRKRSKYAQG